MPFDLRKDAHKLLALLLITDAGFIAIHFIYVYHWLPISYSTPSGEERPFLKLLSVEQDRGYPEIFQYIQELWLALLLFGLGMKRKQSVYFVWAALFFYIMIDDSLGIHEMMSGVLDGDFALPSLFGMPNRSFGEIIVVAVMGPTVLILLGLGYWRSDARARRDSHVLVLLMAVMVFFAFIVDLAHDAFLAYPNLALFLGGLEDGGEMVAMSLMLGFAFAIFSNAVSSTSAPAAQKVADSPSPAHGAPKVEV